MSVTAVSAASGAFAQTAGALPVSSAWLAETARSLGSGIDRVLMTADLLSSTASDAQAGELADTIRREAGDFATATAGFVPDSGSQDRALLLSSRRLVLAIEDLIDKVVWRNHARQALARAATSVPAVSEAFSGAVSDLSAQGVMWLSAGDHETGASLIKARESLDQSGRYLVLLLGSITANEPYTPAGLDLIATRYDATAQRLFQELDRLPPSVASLRRTIAARQLVDLGSGSDGLFALRRHLFRADDTVSASLRRLHDIGSAIAQSARRAAAELAHRAESEKHAREANAWAIPAVVGLATGLLVTVALRPWRRTVIEPGLAEPAPSAPPPAPDPDAPSSQPSDLGARLLLVEDEPLTRVVTRTLLERKGFAVTEAETGAEAIAHAEAEAFAAALVDLRLPDMSGAEVIRRVRQQPWGGACPVIALTGGLVEADAEAALAAGADEVVSKPLRWETVAARLDAPDTAEIALSPDTVPSGTAYSDAAIRDMREMLPVQRVGELIRSAMASLSELRAALGAAWSLGDRAKVGAIAHRIAGLAGVYGCQALRQAAQSLELAIERGDIDPSHPFAAVERGIEPALAYLESHVVAGRPPPVAAYKRFEPGATVEHD